MNKEFLEQVKIKTVQFLIGKTGSILTPIVTFLFASACVFLTQKLPFLSDFIKQINTQETVYGLNIALVGLINLWLNSLLTKNVKNVQEKLKENGSPDLDVDGWFGKNSEQALKEHIKKITKTKTPIKKKVNNVNKTRKRPQPKKPATTRSPKSKRV